MKALLIQKSVSCPLINLLRLCSFHNAVYCLANCLFFINIIVGHYYKIRNWCFLIAVKPFFWTQYWIQWYFYDFIIVHNKIRKNYRESIYCESDCIYDDFWLFGCSFKAGSYIDAGWLQALCGAATLVALHRCKVRLLCK